MLAYVLALAVGVGSLGIYLAAFFLPEIHRKSDFYWSGVGLFYALVLWVCAGRITGGVLLGQIASVALLGWFGWQTVTLRRQLIPAEQQTELPSSEQVKQQAQSLTNNLRSQLSKLSIPESVAQLPDKVSGLFGNLKKQAAGKAASLKQPTAKPTAAKPEQPTVTQPSPPPAPPPKPFQTEPEIAAAAPAIEEIAPEVDFAPPAESTAPQMPVSWVVDISTTPEAAPTEEKEPPELIRPNPPAPEIVEAAVEDAEAKNLPSSPPETDKPESPFDKIEKSGS